ncbi:MULTISPECIES: P-loop NTPase fold protein [Flavobacterium]|uniref:P-loop NTPase fold protein n=1 Tax=Flavobacterium jumunjinense TaxID=998845 RepID=A0ABV5GRW1_9FLAO|nr:MULTISPECIES: P-loop NTPase fold protein [Flavobacterium]
MRIVENLVELAIGNSPENYDVAIVPWDGKGSLNELIQIALDTYKIDLETLETLNLEKGHAIINENGKTVLFIVTINQGTTTESLKQNLKAAIPLYYEYLLSKKIWLPLLSTGVDGLSFEESYEVTTEILNELKNYINQFDYQFTVSLPNTNEGMVLYKKITKNNKQLRERKTYTIKPSLNIIQSKYKVTFYLVGTHWDDSNQAERFYEEQIWENGNDNDSFYEVVDDVKVGDVLIVKSAFVKNKKSTLRIKAFGIVTENFNTGRKLSVNWINVLEEAYDIEGLGYYRNTIATINQDDLITILTGMGSQNFESLFYDIQLSKNITTLPGILSDSDSGEDYLDISNDTNAFARVIAAKSFEPPLAIALLGKWGSGKSFFMRKLKEDVQLLSKTNPPKGFCEGIAHVHFNAWSYMDANLWASIVTRIFGALNEYINNDESLTKKEKKALEEQLFLKLTLSKEELNDLKNQKASLDNRITALEGDKKTLKKELQDRIDSIKKKTLFDIVKKVNDAFKVQEKIENTLNNNPTFVNSLEKFEKIVPRQYWENPTTFYNELKSIHTFIKAFFQRSKWKTNLLWVLGIAILIFVTPVFTFLINLLLSWQDFTISNKTWVTITIIGGIVTRTIDTYLKLKKQIAPFWTIKEDYENKKANAIFELEQEEKALRLEIENYREEIIQIDQQINTNKELIVTLEFRIKNTLSTEALYTFIEKRANSEDYKKHLGIISLIRKDFEILSGLLTGHQSELVTNEESTEFKKLFHNKKPLERIILYIDDLDRCPEERVVEVLEAVNLLMAFPLFVVVVGIDPRWVKNALIKKHHLQFTGYLDKEEKKTIDVIEASSYLEKIFQIPFHIKSARTENVKTMIRKLGNIQPQFQQLNTETTNVSTSNTVENSKTDDVFDVDTNAPIKTTKIDRKNTLEILRFTEKEIKLLEDMSDIIGNSPRAIKRFVNIYRVIKAHDDFTLHGEDEKEYIILLFLLALAVGKYNHHLKSFEKHIANLENKKHTLSSLNDDLSIIFKEIDSNEKLLSITFEEFNHHYQFIKRFTFKNI